MARARIYPGDNKDGVTLIDEPAKQAVLRLQIEDVILVDPGRNKQQRCPEYSVRARGVLDQLHKLVAVDDLAGCDSEVAADSEGQGVILSDGKYPAPVLQIEEQVFQPADQAAARCFQGP